MTGGEWTEVWYQPFDGGEPEQFGEATKWQHYYVAGTEDFRVDISYTGKSTTHMDVFFNDSADSMRSDSAAPDYSTIHAVQSADGVWHFSSLTQWFDIDAAKKTLVVYTINNRTSSDWKPFAWDENGTDIVLLSSDQRSMLFAPGESGTEDTAGTPVEDFHVIRSSNLEDRMRKLGLSPALEAVGSNPVFQLDSVEDKEFFWSIFREDKEPLGSTYPGLAASMSAYDSAFFRNHVLLAISWKTGMSYYTEEEFRVSKVVSDHTLHLRIGLEYPTGKGFSAMEQHYWIFVPVSRSEMADVTAFDATWSSQSLPPDWTEPVNPDWKKEGVLYLPLGS